MVREKERAHASTVWRRVIDALSSQVNFSNINLLLVALLRIETCNVRHPVYLLLFWNRAMTDMESARSGKGAHEEYIDMERQRILRMHTWQVCICIYTCIFNHVYMYVYNNICIYIWFCVDMLCVYSSTHMYTCLYIYKYNFLGGCVAVCWHA